MIEFKETDYVNYKGRKCLSYDAVFKALEKMLRVSRSISGICHSNGLCYIRDGFGETSVTSIKYDVTDTLETIVDGMLAGTQVYEERINHLKETE